jgi:cytosine/adenosine deaminase-related metal-dependent hydrolase
MKRSTGGTRGNPDSDENTVGRSRRGFLKTGLGLVGGAAMAPAVSSVSAQSGALDAVRDRIERETRDPKGRVLLKGATIISMDPKVGNLARGDLLLEGKKIVDIKPEISATAAVLDASGTIMIPGFGDTHRHPTGMTWTLEGLSPLPYTSPPSPIARLAGRKPAPSGGGGNSINAQTQPEDLYAATFVTALTCIKSGVTCHMDWAGNARSPEFADAAVQALIDSGARAVYGYGGTTSVSNERPYEDLVRLQKKFFSSSDQLVTLYLATNIRVPDQQTIDRIKFARDHGLRITIDGADWPEQGEIIVRLGKGGHLGPDITIVHLNDVGEAAWKTMAEHGVTVSLSPFSETLIGIADASPPIQEALTAGIRPSLSSDVFQFSDFFTIMRMALNFQRSEAFASWYKGDANPPAPISLRDVLEFATVQGVKANGLLDKCGTLTPGKEADLMLVRYDDVNTVTLPNALAAVVMAADTSNVSTVFIGGKLKKFDRQLLGTDEAKGARLYRESRDRVFARAGYKLDSLK